MEEKTYTILDIIPLKGDKMFSRKGNLLIHNDPIFSDKVFATFSDDVSTLQKNNVVSILNYGYKMMSLYGQMRDNMHIASVTDSIKEMEKVYDEYMNYKTCYKIE